MEYAKIAIIAVLVVCCAAFSSSLNGVGKPIIGLKSFNDRLDGLREGSTEELARTDVGQGPYEAQELRTELELLRTNAQEMRTELSFLHGKIQGLEARLDEQKAETRLSNQLLKDDIDRRMTKFGQSARRNSSKQFEISLPISFSAYKIVQGFPYRLPDQTLVFDREFVNDYGGYDKTTGVFTAPISGVYVFSFYIVEDGYDWFNATLMVDDTVVAAAKADHGEQFVTGGSVVRVDREISLPISFSAYKIVQGFPYRLPDQTLVFDREFVNDYGGYDKTTGVFTTPISGVYVFSFYIVEDGYDWFNATLMVDDTVVAAAKADHGEQFVTGDSVVRVDRGEKVRVKCTGYSKWSVFWTAAGFSRFSGYLLYVS